MSKPRNWQAAFDALGGLGGQFGPGGRAAMTDDDCKAVVMAVERAVRRADAGLPEPKSHRKAFDRLDRACRKKAVVLDVVTAPGTVLTKAGMRKVQAFADGIVSGKIKTRPATAADFGE